jgi:hypothetical protein
MFSTIRKLRPYFHSLREIGDQVSLDMKFPTNWDSNNILKIATGSSINLKMQDKNNNFQLLSFINPATDDGYDAVVTCVCEVIKYNIELEEKNALLLKKIQELEDIFKVEPLDKLKNLEIKPNEYNLYEEGPSLVGETDRKRSKGNKSVQAEGDKRPENIK